MAKFNYSQLAAGSVVLAVLTACSPAPDEQNLNSMEAGIVATTAAVPEAENPPQAAALPGGGRTAEVRERFATYCSSCHGTDLSGGRAPSLFNPRLLSELSDESIRTVVLEGIPSVGMPPFQGILNVDQITQLIVYLRNEADEFAENPTFVPSPDGVVIHSQKQSFQIEVLATGLDVPWGLDFLPDGRMLVTERGGRLRIMENDQLLPEPVTGTPEVYVGQDAGMLDVAVHPDYEDNGWIYLSYVEVVPGYVTPEEPVLDDRGRPERPPNMTVIIRGRINEQNQWTDTQELFRAAADLYTSSGSHYGSRFLFDGEGHLFYTLGERGEGGNAQDLSNPLGKIHRINDDGTVPEDNPFVGVEGALPTIWTYGHRNPQGLAYDPNTGLMWESEHGPSGGDEVNIIERGKNYGWAVISMGLERGISQTSAPGMEQPVAHYTPSLSPSGITFYDGEQYPGWQQSLFVAGLAGQQLRRLEVSGREVVEQEVLFDQFGRTRTAVQGPDGLLYALLQNPTGSGTGLSLSAATPGIVIRLVPVEPE